MVNYPGDLPARRSTYLIGARLGLPSCGARGRKRPAASHSPSAVAAIFNARADERQSPIAATISARISSSTAVSVVRSPP